MMRRAAFTLIEILVVVLVIVLMMTLAIPAFNAVRGGTDFTSEVYDISGTFEQARAYAMANNTFVLVGLMEISGTASSSTTPQVTGTGQLAIAIVASQNGTQPYRSDLLSGNIANWPNDYGNGAGTGGSGAALTAVTKVRIFQGIHVVDLQGGAFPLPTSGGMARPAVTSVYYDIPNPGCISSAGFAWPIGSKFSQTSGPTAPQYAFTKPSVAPGVIAVVEYDPQGSARIISSANLDAIPHYIELGLQPAHGSIPAPLTSGSGGEIAAIQIDGMSGASRIYRP